MREKIKGAVLRGIVVALVVGFLQTVFGTLNYVQVAGLGIGAMTSELFLKVQLQKFSKRYHSRVGRTAPLDRS
jgi:uncharacterized transporter YbjL